MIPGMTMRSTVDLHTHTIASDGLLAPAVLVQRAATQGLSVLAICDHDTIDGLAEASAEAGEAGITLVPGVELSTSIRGFEVHILGYFVDRDDFAFREKLADLAQSRIRRLERMVERLNDLGYPIALEPLLAQAETGTVGRPHIARALIEIGAVGSVSEAFDTLLTPGKPGFVPRDRFTPEDAVAMILANGAIPVLAHPYTTGDPETTLDRLMAAGLRGMEVFYGEYDADQHAALLAMAQQRGLIPTGGSDYHGPNFKEGRDLGSAPVPTWVWEQLQAERGR